MKINTVKREYRSEFSQAYKHLYKEGELSYLTEILDSAQEGNNKNFNFNIFLISGIPCLWVNSEKYSFSKEVLENGQKLFEAFLNLLVTIRTIHSQ
jgi:hypothetical protein